MHFTYFSLKRTYLRTLHTVQKPMLARFDLTPARFDLLFILTRLPRHWSMWQSKIRKELGVCAATVCRMLKSLEILGLVARKRQTFRDTRQVEVRLTVAGRSWMKRVLKWLRLGKPGPCQETTHRLFVKKWWCDSACLVELDNFQAFFGRLRKTLEDGATLYYPWHPDD